MTDEKRYCGKKCAKNRLLISHKNGNRGEDTVKSSQWRKVKKRTVEKSQTTADKPQEWKLRRGRADNLWTGHVSLLRIKTDSVQFILPTGIDTRAGNLLKIPTYF